MRLGRAGVMLWSFASQWLTKRQVFYLFILWQWEGGCERGEGERGLVVWLQPWTEYTWVGMSALPPRAFSAGQPSAALGAAEFQREGYTRTTLAVTQQFVTLRAGFVGLRSAVPVCVIAPWGLVRVRKGALPSGELPRLEVRLTHLAAFCHGSPMGSWFPSTALPWLGGNWGCAAPVLAAAAARDSGQGDTAQPPWTGGFMLIFSPSLPKRETTLEFAFYFFSAGKGGQSNVVICLWALQWLSVFCL